MDRENFIALLKHPEKLDKVNVEAFRDLSGRYPYCSSIQVLLAYGLFTENDLDFNLQLKRAAACVSSRKKLRMLFLVKSKEHTIIPETIQEEEILPPVLQEEIHEIEATAPQPSTIEEIKTELVEEFSPVQNSVAGKPDSSKLELIRIIHRRLFEIESAKLHSFEEEIPVEEEISKEISYGSEEKSADEIPEQEEQEKLIRTKEEILERFIQEEPSISSPRATFFNPSDFAAQSNADAEEIVSETLARLYHEQGNHAKAIKIYEKLTLLFPEKSRYFADQILKINE